MCSILSQIQCEDKKKREKIKIYDFYDIYKPVTIKNDSFKTVANVFNIKFDRYSPRGLVLCKSDRTAKCHSWTSSRTLKPCGIALYPPPQFLNP